LKRHILSEQMAGTTSEGNDVEYLSQIFQFFFEISTCQKFSGLISESLRITRIIVIIYKGRSKNQEIQFQSEFFENSI
jgi:hypothetical protein